ncbi:Cell wall protein PRY3 [Penicillium rolfsii]|nr:Cell wall protein PRY3 [Penicillium rolfsii]
MAANCCRIWSLLLLPVIFSSFITSTEAKTVAVTVQTTVQATATAPSPPTYTSLREFKDTVLQVTNEYRKAHDAEPLVWNDTLAKYSSKWAETCIWKHSDGPYGENLAFGFPNASSTVEAWGNEREYYNFDRPTGFTEKTGHFTQLVWKSTTEVGCAAVDCGYTEGDNKDRRDTSDTSKIKSSRIRPREPDGSTRAQGWYVVCEYTPPGNVVGDHNEYFKKNVKPVGKTSSATKSAATSTSQPTGSAGMKTGMDSKTRTILLALGSLAIGRSLYT